MKSHHTTQQDVETRAAAARRTRSGGGLSAVGPDHARQHTQQQTMHHGTYSVAQRQRLARMFGPAAGGAPAQRQKNTTGMPDAVKEQMETTLQADFSNVRIHPNSSKAPEVGAIAYTQGHDVHFAPGQFQPDSSAGQSLLGHELTHVVQQRQGRVQPTIEVGGMPVNDDVALEHEADQLGSKVTSAATPVQSKTPDRGADSLQRQVPEDELMQGKFTAQRQSMDEEDML